LYETTDENIWKTQMGLWEKANLGQSAVGAATISGGVEGQGLQRGRVTIVL